MSAAAELHKTAECQLARLGETQIISVDGRFLSRCAAPATHAEKTAVVLQQWHISKLCLRLPRVTVCVNDCARTSLGDPTSLQVELRKAQVALEALGYDRCPSVPDLI
jgi:hypothetical protein